jgi:transcriptional regulator with XRE-family HTH domain
MRQPLIRRQVLARCIGVDRHLGGLASADRRYEIEGDHAAFFAGQLQGGIRDTYFHGANSRAVNTLQMKTYMLYHLDMISSNLLREARLRAGLTQAELGARMHKAASAIGRWERGEVKPSLETLREAIRAAGLELMLGIAVADDHDIALIRRCLAQSPAERLDNLVSAVRAVSSMAEAAHG